MTDRDHDVLTLLLLDPCLTTDEAIREAVARQGRPVEPRERDAVRRGKRGVPRDLEPVAIAEAA